MLRRGLVATDRRVVVVLNKDVTVLLHDSHAALVSLLLVRFVELFGKSRDFTVEALLNRADRRVGVAGRTLLLDLGRLRAVPLGSVEILLEADLILEIRDLLFVLLSHFLDHLLILLLCEPERLA